MLERRGTHKPHRSGPWGGGLTRRACDRSRLCGVSRFSAAAVTSQPLTAPSHPFPPPLGLLFIARDWGEGGGVRHEGAGK